MLDTLRTLLIAELRTLYAAELLLEDGLGRLVKAANDSELKAVLTEHLEQTEGHARRMEAVFRELSESPRGGRAESIKTLLHEGEDRLGGGGDAHVLDAAMIAAARRVEHWEIAAYGTAAIYAERLSLTEVAALLRRTLEDEQAAGRRLEQMARTLRLESDLEE